MQSQIRRLRNSQIKTFLKLMKGTKGKNDNAYNKKK